MKCCLLGAACLLPLKVLAALQVQLTASLPSPQLLGTAVTWTATATDSNPGVLTYRYIVKRGNSSLMARDYSQANLFKWGSSVWEGNYDIQVTVRNNSTQETARLSVPFMLATRITGQSPVVSATANPLVGMFSAPACATGSRIRVQFQTSGQPWAYTGWRSCATSSSMNIYVAGMLPSTRYTMRAQTSTAGSVTTGPAVSFVTGAMSASGPVVTIPVKGNSQSSVADKVLVSDFVNLGGTRSFPVASDPKGNIIWYYSAFEDPAQHGALLTRVVPGGTVLVLANGANSANSATQLQILREIDFAGNAIRETNASRIGEQLVALGLPSDCSLGSSLCAFGAFHHEALRLPNGNTMAFGSIEKIYPAGTQGSPTPIDILGAIVVELDPNFQVVWYWNSFDHMDVNRAAVFGETCTPGFGACPSMFLTTGVANDWLHANSIQYTADHNLLLSLRHQDWVVKIDYRDRAGTKDVLWRLGKDGDFSIVSNDPMPWFSHQHDAGFESNGLMTVFDDGNARFVANPAAHSRGQALSVDENGRIATLVLNADLGVYSFALGSAQLLGNGNYHFLPGSNIPGLFSQSIEVLPDGTINYIQQSNSTAYRSFRMPSLYEPPPT